MEVPKALPKRILHLPLHHWILLLLRQLRRMKVDIERHDLSAIRLSCIGQEAILFTGTCCRPTMTAALLSSSTKPLQLRDQSLDMRGDDEHDRRRQERKDIERRQMRHGDDHPKHRDLRHHAEERVKTQPHGEVEDDAHHYQCCSINHLQLS
jgi:hypothetical protein